MEESLKEYQEESLWNFLTDSGKNLRKGFWRNNEENPVTEENPGGNLVSHMKEILQGFTQFPQFKNSFKSTSWDYYMTLFSMISWRFLLEFLEPLFWRFFKELFLSYIFLDFFARGISGIPSKNPSGTPK